MNIELIALVFGIVSAPLSAWLSSRLERRKYEVQLSALQKEVEKQSSDVKAGELENVRTANSILMETIVEPLRQEIKQLRDEVDRLNQALEQISACRHAHDCPVTRKLRYQALPGQVEGGELSAGQERLRARLPPIDTGA